MRFMFIIILLFSISAYAEKKLDDEILYNCPNFSDIKYLQGQFTASTSYNGFQTRWYSVQTFPEKELNIGSFVRANMGNDCIGGLCEIQCVYNPNSINGKFVFLEIPFQAYRFSREGSGQWDTHVCESSDPASCQFYMVSDPIK
jgi:hypothetical protein